MRAVEGSLGHSLKARRKRGTRWTRAVGIIPATPYKVIIRCGLVWEKARLGAPGLGG